MASPSISNHHSSNNYLKLVKPELEEIFRKPYPQIFAEVWEYYEQAMLEHFPFIGGDRSSGTKNLTGCMFFIAIGVVGKRYGLSIHDWGRLSTTLYERYDWHNAFKNRHIIGTPLWHSGSLSNRREIRYKCPIL